MRRSTLLDQGFPSYSNWGAVKSGENTEPTGCRFAPYRKEVLVFKSSRPDVGTMRSGTRPRQGFTLVELLMTISIISILVAIAVPGVQLARESARRMGCQSNLRQLAQATITHEQSLGALPGWRNAIESYPDKVSWAVKLLPFLGNREAADWFDNYSPGGEDMSSKRLPLYVCPTAWYDVVRVSKSPLCYVANAGTGCEHSVDDPFDNGRQWLGDGVFADAVGADDYQPARYSTTLISEGGGVSTTFMFSERCGSTVFGDDVSWTASQSAVEPATSNASKSTHLFLLPKSLADGDVPQPSTVYRVVNPVQGHPVTGDEAASTWRFRFPSSPHTGDGACFVFCDSHVQYVSAKLDSWVYAQLMSSQRGRLSPRASAWEQYDDDKDPATEPVRYIVGDGDIPTR